MQKDNIYFAESGLTSTSANHIANMAKEYVQTLEKELNATSFLNGTIALIGGEETPTMKGVKDLHYISPDLNSIAEAHSLIAWLREALKAKENLKKEVERMPLKQYAEANNLSYPEEPSREEPVTKDDVLAEWSIKDRNRYLALGAKVSVYGKFLHPDGAFSDARELLKERVNNPVEYRESGRDTIVKKYEPSIDVSTVDKKFFELQGVWRKAQAELNAYEHKIQLGIDADTNQKNSSYAEKYKEYCANLVSISAQFKEWKDKELQRIANLKIVIPNELKCIYDIITALSK